MSNAVLSIVYADVPGFPAGSAVNHIVASITDTSVTPPTSVSQNIASGTAAATFTNVAAGDYAFSVGAAAASGTLLGTPVTGTFSITAPATISLSLPSAVTAAQA